MAMEIKEYVGHIPKKIEDFKDPKAKVADKKADKKPAAKK